MSDFDIIDNNEFTKPKNYKNTNNSSSSEVYNKFDIFKNSENESENEINNGSENEIIESENESNNGSESESIENESETLKFSESEETINYVYVLSINNFPYFVFQNKKQAKEKLINLAHYYIEKLHDDYEYSFNIRLKITNEGYVISKSNKYSIFNYEENLLSLKYNKVKSNLNI